MLHAANWSLSRVVHPPVAVLPSCDDAHYTARLVLESPSVVLFSSIFQFGHSSRRSSHVSRRQPANKPLSVYGFTRSILHCLDTACLHAPQCTIYLSQSDMDVGSRVKLYSTARWPSYPKGVSWTGNTTDYPHWTREPSKRWISLRA